MVIAAAPSAVFANNTSPITNPQTAHTPIKSNTEINYTTPATEPELEIGSVAEREDSTPIKVTLIHLVEVLGVNGDNKVMERVYEDESIKQKLADEVKNNNGLMTVEELQDLAYDVSKLIVKEKGFLLATVYLPVQKVVEGVVKFALLPGKLGKVDVVNNTIYKSKVITDAFRPYIGKPVIKSEAEEVLFRLQDMPGFKATGAFSPGEALGDTLLTLTAIESPYKTMFFTDDFGSEFTGRIRSGTKVTKNNWFKQKDALSVLMYFVQTPDGVNEDSSVGGTIDCCDGSIAYEMGIDDLNKYRGGVEVSRANYDVGNVDELTLATFGFEGESLNISAYVSYQLMRGRLHNGVFRTTVSQINAKTKRLKQLLSEDKLTVFQSGYDFDFLDELLTGGRNLGGIQLVTGRLKKGNASNSRLEADGDFTKLTYSLNRSQNLPKWFGLDMDLNLRFDGQYTENKLVGVQQMGIGGPSSVRAYPTGAFLADRGNYAAVDWVFNDVFKQNLFNYSFDPYVFFDYAKGKAVEGETFAVKQVHLGSYGFGFNWRYDKWTFGMVVARVLGSTWLRELPISEGGRNVVGKKSTQLYNSVKYEF